MDSKLTMNTGFSIFPSTNQGSAMAVASDARLGSARRPDPAVKARSRRLSRERPACALPRPAEGERGHGLHRESHQSSSTRTASTTAVARIMESNRQTETIDHFQ